MVTQAMTNPERISDERWSDAERRAIAYELCSQRGLPPNRTDTGGVELWETFLPLADLMLGEVSRLLARRSPPAQEGMVRALEWKPNGSHDPDSVWTGELCGLRVYYAIEHAGRVFSLERGWFLSEHGRDDLGLFPSRAEAEQFAENDWRSKITSALAPASDAVKPGDET